MVHDVWYMKNPLTSGGKLDTKFKSGAEWRGNAKGRPPGSTSFKVFAQEYLLSLPDEEKAERLRKLADEDFFALWRMAEGNPHSTEDVKHTIAPQPIMKLGQVDSSPVELPSADHEMPPMQGASS